MLIQPGFLSAGVSGWISTIGTINTSNANARSIISDSDGNVYTTGVDQSQILVVKQDSQGAILWQKKFSGSFLSVGHGIGLDSSNNVYVSGENTVTSGGGMGIQLIKLDSSGTLQWQKRLFNIEAVKGIAVNASGDSFIIATGRIGGDLTIQLVKYDSSGTLQWQKTLGAGSSELGNAVAIDSSSNVYIIGRSSISGSNQLQLAKYNSSGSIQWQRSLSSAVTGNDISLDSSGNIYITGTISGSGSAALLAKYNNSGSLQWQKGIDSTLGGYSIKATPSGDFYLIGGIASGIIVANFDTSGNFLWQRSFTYSISSDYNNLWLDDKSIYIAGRASITGANAALIVKLDNNGDGAGTFVLNSQTFTYQTVSRSLSTTSLTSNTTSLADQTSSLTDSTSSLTSNNSSINSALVQI